MKEQFFTGKAMNRDVAHKAQMEKTRTVTFIASTPSTDRDGDVTNSKGWRLENYKNNPVIGYQHQVVSHGLCIAPDPDDIIGIGKNLRVNEKGHLLVDIQFEDKETNPKAEKIFRKVLNGTLNAVSVGFIPVANENGELSRKGIEEMGEDPGANYLFGQELLEISVVNVPANPDAVAIRKGIKSQTAGAIVNLSKMLDKSYSELEGMTVGQIVKALEGDKKTEIEVKIMDNEELQKALKEMRDRLEAFEKSQSTTEIVIDNGDNGVRIKETDSNESKEAPSDGVSSIEELELQIKHKQIENE